MRFATIGAGFWARFQLAGWSEVGGAECVAIYSRTRVKAEGLAREFGIPTVYDNPEQMLLQERLDFVDVVTNIESHEEFVRLAAKRSLPVICQKPLAPSVQVAESLVQCCSDAGVLLLVNENWRWQRPIRELKAVLDSGEIGHPFRARLDMISGFPVFKNQPELKHLKEFILADLGSHILDVARFLFGETRSLYCQTHQVHKDIAGEDVATVILDMTCDTTVIVELAYAENYLERDRFPGTAIFIEGTRGSVELTLDFEIRVTSERGTSRRRVTPPHFSWADPAYDVVHASIVPCQANLLAAVKGEGSAETTGEDNLKTVRLVFAAYESARTGKLLQLL